MVLRCAEEKKARLTSLYGLIFFTTKNNPRKRPRIDLHHLINSLLGLQDLIISSAYISEGFVTCTLKAELPWEHSRRAGCEHPLLEFHQWSHRKIKAPPMGLL